MAANFSFTISGLKELDRALGELPKATGRRVLQRTLSQAGQPIADAAQANAPTLTGNLRASIHVSTRKPVGADLAKAAYADVLASGGSQSEARAALRAVNRSGIKPFAEVFVGPGRHPQAIQQEFGNRNHPPQPFLRPAWDATKDRALRLIQRNLGIEIKKAAERLARKRARGK